MLEGMTCGDSVQMHNRYRPEFPISCPHGPTSWGRWAAYVAGTLLVLMRELGVRFHDSISILVLCSIKTLLFLVVLKVIIWTKWQNIWKHLLEKVEICTHILRRTIVLTEESMWKQISSAVPEGKGVSSSAALEVATMTAIAAAHGKLSQRLLDWVTIEK